MKTNHSTLLLASAIALFAAGRSQGQLVTNDLSREFPIATNPGGAWSFGWKQTVGGTFTLLTFAKNFLSENGVPMFMWQVSDSAPPGMARVMGPGTAVSAGGQFVAPPGTVYFFPGVGEPQNFGVVRFTVPAGRGGAYTVKASVRDVFDGSYQGDTDFHVIHNNVELFSQFLAPHTTAGFTNVVALAAGDTVDFLIGRGADGIQTGSALKLQATLTPATVCTPHTGTATAQVVNGFVVGATITDNGCGYTNAPMVLIQGGGGTGATATAVVVDGRVTAININSTGCCYTNTPRIVIGSPPFVPTVGISVSKVKVKQNVVLGRRYVLESSTDLATWTATSPPFTADSETIENEFDVNVTGRFFRIREVP